MFFTATVCSNSTVKFDKSTHDLKQNYMKLNKKGHKTQIKHTTEFNNKMKYFWAICLNEAMLDNR